DEDKSGFTLSKAISTYHSHVDRNVLKQSMSENEMDELIEKAKDYDYVIVGTFTMLPGSYYVTFINKLLESDITVIGIAMRNPYDADYVQDVPAYINTYEFSYPALKTAAGAIFGEITVNGSLPVTLSSNKAE